MKIDNLFIKHELSLILKEKGFNNPSLAYYDKKELKLSKTPEYLRSNSSFIEAALDDYCLAPLYQEVIDWLREVHNLWIIVLPGSHADAEWFIYELQNYKETKAKGIEYYYPEAIEKAIEEALNLI